MNPQSGMNNAVQVEDRRKMEDRRNAPRHKAAGQVSFRLADEMHLAFEGRLLDISSSGFRVRHGNNHLRSGQECEFTLPGSTGKARVVWNRITPEHIETGFLILNCDTA